MKKTIISFCLIFPALVFAQEVEKTDINNSLDIKWGTESHVIQCSNFIITPPLRDLMEKDLDENQNNGQVIGEQKDKRDLPVQTFVYNEENDGPIYGNDPTIIQDKHGDKITKNKVLLQNWFGQNSSAFRPLDPTGAPGPNHFVQAINGDKYKIWSKTGQTLGSGNISSLFPSGNGDGDPIVLYDKAADRWFMAQFSGGSSNTIFIAVSQTADPLGSWYSYEFSSPSFPDYLKFSAWQDGYYMTANFSQKVFAFNRTKMLAGDNTAEAVYQSFNPPSGGGFFVPMPADASDGVMPGSGTPCPIFSYSDNAWGGGNVDAVKIYNASVTWNGPSSNLQVTSAGTLPTNAFDASYSPSWNDIPQKGTSQKLDGIGGVVWFRVQWKKWEGYNTAVLNWGVKINSTQRGIFWCELRQDQTSGVWSIYQQGIYAPGTDSYWLSGIVMNDAGDIALAYAKSSSNTYMSLGYTGRHASDPLGTMPLGEGIAVHGAGSQSGGNRVGDYAQLTLDPDGHSFWYTGEYFLTGGSARTRIYSFNLLGPLGIENQSLEDVSLYPSPNNGNFVVEGLDEGSVYSIYNVDGRLIFSNVVNNDLTKVALPSVKNGVYFLESTKNGQQGRIKFIVSK